MYLIIQCKNISCNKFSFFKKKRKYFNNEKRRIYGNHYVEVFKVAKENFEQQDNPSHVKIVINKNKRPSGEHSRSYNSLVSDEIAVLMPNDTTNNRNIVLHYRNSGLITAYFRTS